MRFHTLIAAIGILDDPEYPVKVTPQNVQKRGGNCADLSFPTDEDLWDFHHISNKDNH